MQPLTFFVCPRSLTKTSSEPTNCSSHRRRDGTEINASCDIVTKSHLLVRCLLPRCHPEVNTADATAVGKRGTGNVRTGVSAVDVEEEGVIIEMNLADEAAAHEVLAEANGIEDTTLVCVRP